jgi:hypothetical protein
MSESTYLNLLSLIEEDLMKKNTTFREAISPREKLVWGKKKSLIVFIVTYSGFSIHDGTLLHSKSQQLFEHT